VSRSNPTLVEKAYRKAQEDTALTKLCYPCAQGFHSSCRNTADGKRFERNCQTPCACKKAKHTIGLDSCAAFSHDGFDSHRCCKPVKGVWPLGNPFSIRLGPNRETVEVPLCGVHLAGRRRRQANDEKRQAEWEESRARAQREDQNKQAAQDYCDRIAHYDITAHPAKVDGRYDGSVAIQGETVMKVIEQLVLLGREMEIGEDEIIEMVREPGVTA
jgi:hypothetical protein